MLAEIQKGLFARAVKLREDNTRTITDVNEFKAYFTPKNKSEDKAEIHGGFAMCHFIDGCPEMDAVIKDLKVTVRCIPLENNGGDGTCLFSGKPGAKRAVFAKAY